MENKYNDSRDSRVSLKLSPTLHVDVKKVATMSDMSLNGLIHDLLKAHVIENKHLIGEYERIVPKKK